MQVWRKIRRTFRNPLRVRYYIKEKEKNKWVVKRWSFTAFPTLNTSYVCSFPWGNQFMWSYDAGKEDSDICRDFWKTKYDAEIILASVLLYNQSEKNKKIPQEWGTLVAAKRIEGSIIKFGET